MAAAPGGRPEVHVTVVLDRAGQEPKPLTLTATYDDQGLNALPQDTTGGSYFTAQGAGPVIQGMGAYGVALSQLVTSSGVALDNVTTIDVRPAVRDGGTLSSAAGDLLQPGGAGFPFTFDALPVLTTTTGGNIDLWVGQRNPGSAQAHPDLANGADFTVGSGETLAVVIHVASTLLSPSVTAPRTTVDDGDRVDFTGSVESIEPGDSPTWTWDFGGDGTAGPGGATTSHVFSKPGTYPVIATVQADDGSSGSATVTITVRGGSSPPATTSPPPTGPDLGTGGSKAPNVGPREGEGPRAGGAPTDRSGTGGPGPTFDPRSAQPSVSNSVSGGARAEGDVVGYLLSDGEAVAPAAQAAAKPLDDSAPAARDGVMGHDVAAWIVGALVVVALLAVGAGSERRRPARAGRRRPRGRA